MVKFLIIRFSSIGDIVLTTPIIRCLKKQMDGAEIHFLTKKQFAGVLSANPYIDHLWLYENNLDELIRQLQGEDFDYIIDLHNNFRSLRVKLKLRTISFSFNKLNLKKWFLVNFKINSLPKIHIVDRYFATLEKFSIINDRKGLDYFILGAKTEEISAKIPNRYIVLVIGAQHETKKATPEILADICNKINFPIIIVGGNNDQTLAASILEKISNIENVINLAGKISLDHSALLVKNASLVITHDTGLMHIAAAFKKKIISIWGNTVPEFGMFPYLPDPESKIFEVKGLKCRPCSKIGFQTCPKSHFKCMSNQDTEAIAFWAKNVLSI